MIKHKQKSDYTRGFWEPKLMGQILQATTYYWRNLEIAIPETDLSGMENGDRVYVENDTDPLHLIKAGSSVPYIPLSGEPMSSPGPVCWKQTGEIHYIFHEVE